MKKISILVMSGLVLAWGASSAFAALSNITVHDLDAGETGNGWWRGPAGAGDVAEDDEVSPGSSEGHQWDLEAMGFDDISTDFSMVGGYNFVAEGSRTPWRYGHLFIDTDGDVKYGTQIGTPPNGAKQGGMDTISNSFLGYEFVVLPTIDQNDAFTGGYEVYSLDRDALLTVYFNVNKTSNPWRADEDLRKATAVGSGTFTLDAGTYADELGVFSGDNATRWTSTYEGLGTILENNTTDYDGFFAHYTYECGNDQINGITPGHGISVSDTGMTLMLLGMTMLGIETVRRRREVKT